MKRKQPIQRLELGSLISFPTTITVMLSESSQGGAMPKKANYVQAGNKKKFIFDLAVELWRYIIYSCLKKIKISRKCFLLQRRNRSLLNLANPTGTGAFSFTWPQGIDQICYLLSLVWHTGLRLLTLPAVTKSSSITGLPYLGFLRVTWLSRRVHTTVLITWYQEAFF